MKENELVLVKQEIAVLKGQLAQMEEESDLRKGENNSLKKKLQSLQIDFDKLSRKV